MLEVLFEVGPTAAIICQGKTEKNHEDPSVVIPGDTVKPSSGARIAIAEGNSNKGRSKMATLWSRLVQVTAR